MTKNNKLSKELDRKAREILEPLNKVASEINVYLGEFGHHQPIVDKYISFMKDLPIKQKRRLYLKTLFLLDRMGSWLYEQNGIHTLGQLLDEIEKSRDMSIKINDEEFFFIPYFTGIGEKRAEIIRARLESIGISKRSDYSNRSK